MMQTKMIFAAVAVLACGIVLVTVTQKADAPLPTELEAADPGLALGDRNAVVDSALRDPVTRTAEVFTPTTVTARGRVLDSKGEAVVGVRLIDHEGSTIAESDGRGAFQFAHDPSEDLPQPDARYFVLRRYAPESGENEPEDILYLVAPHVQAGGRVVDSKGQPIEGVAIRTGIRPLLDFPLPLDDTGPVAMPRRESEVLGTFDFDAVPGGVGQLKFRKSGFLPYVHELAAWSEQGLEIEMTQVSGESFLLTGQVLDPAGWPLARAQVGFGETRVRSDEYGNYALELSPEEVDESGQSLYAGMAGYQTLVTTAPARVDFGEERAIDRDLLLPGRALTISGWVIGPGGQPAGDAVIGLWKEEPMPGAGFAEDLAVDEDAEPHEIGLAPRRVYAVSAEDGSFELGGLRDKEYRLRIIHEEHLALTSIPLRAGASDVELRYPKDNFRTVVCEVVNLDGEAMSGLSVDMLTQAHETAGTNQWMRSEELHSDGDGKVAMPRVPRSEAVQVRIRGPEIVPVHYTLEPEVEDVFEVLVYRRCHFRVETSEVGWRTARFQLEDAAGDALFMGTSPFVLNQQKQLADGKSPVLFASEQAATLVVVGEDGEKRVPLVLRPGEVNVIRF